MSGAGDRRCAAFEHQSGAVLAIPAAAELACAGELGFQDALALACSEARHCCAKLLRL